MTTKPRSIKKSKSQKGCFGKPRYRPESEDKLIARVNAAGNALWEAAHSAGQVTMGDIENYDCYEANPTPIEEDGYDPRWEDSRQCAEDPEYVEPEGNAHIL